MREARPKMLCAVVAPQAHNYLRLGHENFGVQPQLIGLDLLCYRPFIDP